MFLKVLSLLWLYYGAPFAQDFSTIWLNPLDANRLVKTAILQANARSGLVSELQAKALSKKIIKASRCFDLDPMVFTALIWRESNFRHQSTSETGAVGLTQLTKTGIHEVLDRVAANSLRLRSDLREELGSCYPELLKSIPANPDLIDFSEWKRKVAYSPDLALVFGAILFKINFNHDYRVALEKYNGDPKVKVKFAKDVLAVARWISSSFMILPETGSGNSKFLASIQAP